MRVLLKSLAFRRVASRMSALLHGNALYRNLHYCWALQKAKNLANSLPTNIYLEITNTCNARCVMCPYSQMQRPKGVMEMEMFKRVVNDVASCGIKKVGLSFMGEPFLEKTLFDRVRYVKEKGPRVVFNTNASMLSEITPDCL